MTFDLTLVSFDSGQQGVADRDGAFKFLDQYEWERDHPRIRVLVTGEIEMLAHGLIEDDETFESASFRLGSSTPDIFEFIFGFAHAASFVIWNVQATDDEPQVLMPPSTSVEDILLDGTTGERYTSLAIDSAHELELALADGLERWAISEADDA